MSDEPNLVDPPAVLAGALLALAVAVPILVASMVIDPDEHSNLVLLIWFAVMVGFAVGGWGAARRRPDAPFSNGALAALCAYVAIVIVASIVRVIRGGTPESVPLVFNGFMAATFGIIGGLIASRRHFAREKPPSPPSRP